MTSYTGIISLSELKLNFDLKYTVDGADWDSCDSCINCLRAIGRAICHSRPIALEVSWQGGHMQMKQFTDRFAGGSDAFADLYDSFRLPDVALGIKMSKTIVILINNLCSLGYQLATAICNMFKKRKYRWLTRNNLYFVFSPPVGGQ